MERTRRTLRFEDDQGRKFAGQVGSECRVLDRQSARIRAARAGKAEHSPGDSLTGQASAFWWPLIDIKELGEVANRIRRQNDDQPTKEYFAGVAGCDRDNGCSLTLNAMLGARGRCKSSQWVSIPLNLGGRTVHRS